MSPGVSGVPYHDTINTMPEPKVLTALVSWCTLEFMAPTEQRLTLGAPGLFRESGQVHVLVLTKSGKGDEAAVEASEAFRALFTGINLDTGGGRLTIDAPEPPSTEPTESGNWFLASVICSYTYDVVR